MTAMNIQIRYELYSSVLHAKKKHAKLDDDEEEEAENSSEARSFIIKTHRHF